jgi:tetratricopeptide (TPR) repeat protein
MRRRHLVAAIAAAAAGPLAARARQGERVRRIGVLVALVELSALFVVAGPPVSRAVTDDANTCMYRVGDEQIAACTRVIQSGRWSGQALARVYATRGIAYRAKGDLDHATADYHEVIRLDPKLPNAYLELGLAYLYRGNLARAFADVRQASEFHPMDPYGALWVDIVGQRNNLPSRLSEVISNIDMTAWPVPVIRLFLGQTTPAAVLAAAADLDPLKQARQVCEADFFSGEWSLRSGANDEARRLFQLAAGDCPKSFIQWGAAREELKSLGASR